MCVLVYTRMAGKPQGHPYLYIIKLMWHDCISTMARASVWMETHKNRQTFHHHFYLLAISHLGVFLPNAYPHTMSYKFFCPPKKSNKKLLASFWKVINLCVRDGLCMYWSWWLELLLPLFTNTIKTEKSFNPPSKSDGGQYC